MARTKRRGKVARKSRVQTRRNNAMKPRVQTRRNNAVKKSVRRKRPRRSRGKMKGGDGLTPEERRAKIQENLENIKAAFARAEKEKKAQIEAKKAEIEANNGTSNSFTSADMMEAIYKDVSCPNVQVESLAELTKKQAAAAAAKEAEIAEKQKEFLEYFATLKPLEQYVFNECEKKEKEGIEFQKCIQDTFYNIFMCGDVKVR